MKKFLSLFLFLGIGLVLSACNEVEDPLQKETVTITFETNNAMRLHPLTFQRGEAINLPQLETVDGTIFSGWFLDEALTEPASNLENREEDFTLYAAWIEETYDVIVDMYNEVRPTQVFMNEIAMFIVDDLGDLYIQAIKDNPLYTDYGDTYDNPLYQGLIDPDNEDTIIYTWGMNAFIVQRDGTIYAWGDNTYGQLGTGDKVSSEKLINITGQFDLQNDESIIKIVGNEKTTFALTTHGNLYAWGSNTHNMIGEKETTERLTPTNIKDELCGVTDHFLVEYGLCGETDHLITDIVVTEKNVMILTNYHQVFLWGADARLWFDEIEVTSEHISEAIYMYFEGHVKHIVASSNTIVLVSETDEILILGASKLGSGTDHAWSGGPVKIVLRDFYPDNDSDGFPTIEDVFINQGTMMVMLSDGTIWCWGDNSYNLISGKKGYDYYTSAKQLELNFTPQSIAMSSSEACSLDNDGQLWCWGRSSSKNLGQNNEMILSTNYKYVDYLGENTNWDGALEDETALRSPVGPITWMEPEAIIPAPFAEAYRLYNVTRYYITDSPLTIEEGGITAASIVKNLCAIDSNDCDDTEPMVHPEAWAIYAASNGRIQWTLISGNRRWVKEARENHMS